VGGKLFTIGTRDGKEILFALDAATGKELWVTPVGDILGNNWGDGPRGTPAVDVQDFVASNRHWIESARRKLGLETNRKAPEPPTELRLPATRESLQIEYSRGPERVAATDIGGLLVSHSGDHAASVFALLRKWVLERGRQVLKPWLYSQAGRLDVVPRSVQIRLQRTRWGSCSSRRNISLNAALLFVDPELVRYLLVHELCHLTHLNHSQRYWARVRSFEPDYEALDKRLALEWKRLPVWLFDMDNL